MKNKRRDMCVFIRFVIVYILSLKFNTFNLKSKRTTKLINKQTKHELNKIYISLNIIDIFIIFEYYKNLDIIYNSILL